MSSSASRAWMASGSAGQAGGADMGTEVRLLHVARRAVVEIVQAGLADADDPGMLRQRGDVLGRRDRRLGRVVRMDADGAPEIRLGLGHRRQACATAPGVVPMVTISPTPAAAARASTSGTFGLGEVVEVAVGIDQHQTLRRPARRSAGTRPAAPAGPCRRGSGVGQSRPAARASAGTPSWSSIRPMLSGMNGCSTVRDHAQRVGQHAQHRRHPRRIGPAQRPGRLAVDIAVGGADDLPDLLQRLVEDLPVQPAAHQLRQRVGGGQQFRVVLGRRPPARQPPVAVARDQRQRPLRQVAQVVRQLDVDPGDQRLVADSVPSPPNGFSRSRK